MTFQIDFEATRRTGLLLVADAADVAVASSRVITPDTGNRSAAVATAIDAVNGQVSVLATGVSDDGEVLSTLTSAALLTDLSAAGAFLWG